MYSLCRGTGRCGKDGRHGFGHAARAMDARFYRAAAYCAQERYGRAAAAGASRTAPDSQTERERLRAIMPRRSGKLITTERWRLSAKSTLPALIASATAGPF